MLECKGCGGPLAKHNKFGYCWKNCKLEAHRAAYAFYAPKRRASQREKRLKDKEWVLNYYGKVCSCCGITEPIFLTLDHIGNTGAAHRREIGDIYIYTWVVRNKHTLDQFQVLCFNCNSGRQINHGICPHKGTPEDFLPAGLTSIVQSGRMDR